MANGLSLTTTSDNAGIFECPTCKQTIDESSTECRFCSAVIDPAVAAAATETMARINQACSDASFLRTMALSIFVFIGLIFIPYLTSWVGFGGYYFLMVAIPFMSIRWWIKFHNLRSDERDFKRGKVTVIIVSTLGSITLLLFLATRL